MGKRKVMSDGLVADDSDGDERPPQRAKTAKSSSYSASTPKVHIDDDGNKYWEISKARRVTISEFKGTTIVSIREYYEKDGKSLPGKKGISMSLEQYSTFINLLPHIETVLKDDGAKVPRPKYDEDDTLIDNTEENGSNDEGGFLKKSNIDTTSDEDEG